MSLKVQSSDPLGFVSCIEDAADLRTATASDHAYMSTARSCMTAVDRTTLTRYVHVHPSAQQTLIFGCISTPTNRSRVVRVPCKSE